MRKWPDRIFHSMPQMFSFCFFIIVHSAPLTDGSFFRFSLFYHNYYSFSSVSEYFFSVWKDKAMIWRDVWKKDVLSENKEWNPLCQESYKLPSKSKINSMFVLPCKCTVRTVTPVLCHRLTIQSDVSQLFPLCINSYLEDKTQGEKKTTDDLSVILTFRVGIKVLNILNGLT